MKKTLLTLALVLATLAVCTAQQIEIKKILGAYRYKLDGKNLTMGKLSKTVEKNTEAFEIIKKSKINRAIALIIGCAGSGMIGWQLGASSAGGHANWAMAGVGTGLVAISLPISLRAEKNIKEAVQLYNDSLSATSNNGYHPEIKILANARGIGLALNF